MSNSNNLPSTTGISDKQLQEQLGNIQAMRKLAVSPMQYSKRITRNNPGAILILIDQSLSMDEVMLREDGVTESTKANLTTEIVNSFLTPFYKATIKLSMQPRPDPPMNTLCIMTMDQVRALALQIMIQQKKQQHPQ